jgi:hypothetical protein
MVGRCLRLTAARFTYSNVLASIALFAAMGGGAWAVSAIPAADGVIYGCVHKKTGSLRVVKKGKRCKKRERKISWNASGQAGGQGARGDTGSQGSPGVSGSAGTPGAAGAVGATGATGPAGPGPATPANVPLLSENWGTFGNASWSNQPAPLTELFGTTAGRVRTDLTASTQVRLVSNVAQAGTATAAIRVQYSTDQAAWNYLDGGTGPAVNINPTGVKVSSWVDLTAPAKADVFLRVVGINGDGTADPGFGNIILQVK